MLSEGRRGHRSRNIRGCLSGVSSHESAYFRIGGDATAKEGSILVGQVAG